MNVKPNRKTSRDVSPVTRMLAMPAVAEPAVILNVNGARSVRDSRTRALRKAGYKVIEPADCTGALQSGLESKPDVIVINALSGFDDLRLCAQLRANEATRQTPIIGLCAIHSKRHAHYAIACFPEPVKPTALLAIIGLVQRVKAAERQVAELAALNHVLLIKSDIRTHDLLSPLSTISSLAAWIRSEYGHQLSAGGGNYLGLLEQSIEQMRAAVLKAFAVSIQGGGVDHELTSFHGHTAC